MLRLAFVAFNKRQKGELRKRTKKKKKKKKKKKAPQPGKGGGSFLMVMCLITLYLYNACLVVCILANLVSLHLKLLWVGVKSSTITLFGELVIIEVLVIVVILTLVLFW